MKLAETYSHKGGMEFLLKHHKREYQDVLDAIAATDAVNCLKKITEEKTKPPLLFHPESMNFYIKRFLHPRGWTEESLKSKRGFKEPRVNLGKRESRTMDGLKNKVGLEIQFGKYAFMGYDIFSKMVIFSRRGLIECGIEVVAMADLAKEMSTGVSSFTQIKMDMEARGVADLDLPTLVVGIGLTEAEKLACTKKRLRFERKREKMIEAGEVLAPRKKGKPGPKGIGSIYAEEEGIQEEEQVEEEEKGTEEAS